MADTGLSQVGPYSIIRLLHSGPAWHTYLGKHTVRSRTSYTILKVLQAPLNTDEAKEAFLVRARQIKKLKHRNIAELLEAGLVPENGNELGYIAYQYVQGVPIYERFEARERYKPDEVKRVLTPIADALQYAHAMHIVHGNLHPGNILVDERNNVMLTDFSFSSIENSAALPYMAPEQLRGETLAASDQYALAVMAYEWLCGQRPYPFTDRDALLNAQEHTPLPAPRTLNSDISPTLEQVLLKALAVQPDERYPHTLTFSDTYLRALMGFPIPNNIMAPKTAQPKHDVATPVSNGTGTQPIAPAAKNTGGETTPVQPETMKPLPAKKADTHDKKPAARVTKADKASEMPTSAPKTPEKEIPPPEPVRPKIRRFSTGILNNLQQQVTQDLQEGGVLSKRLPGYEERPAQVEMAQVIAQAITNEQHAITEASTGTGKSIAYLLPVVRSGRGAIISTANKALQEQLFYKDIPFIKKNVQEFDAALVKGMGNYICLDRLETERKEGQPHTKHPDFTRLLSIVNEFELTISGDFETLGFTVPAEIRSRVSAERDECAWTECPLFSKCYVRQMKERAEEAQVVVVNHTLLLLDAATNGHILPQREVMIVDEAHHLEEEATRAFTVTVSQSQIYSLLALRRLREHSSPSLQEEAKKQMLLAWDALERIANPGFKGRANLRETVEDGLKLASIIDALASSLEMQRPLFMPDKENTLYDKLVNRTRSLAANIRLVFSANQPDKFVYYVERAQQRSRHISPFEVSAAPLDVTEWLKEFVFNKTHVIATSATLTTTGQNPIDPTDKGPSFVYFRRRVGLDYATYPNVLECILPLSFDYENNALLYLPRHLPLPDYGAGSIGYMKAVASEMMRLAQISRGRAFLLFSSKRMLDFAFDEFLTQLPNDSNLRLLRQGDMTRIELVRTFRETSGAVLFGLKSFWEGVDIAGEALSLVVIDKMPFDPPDDPVQEARVAQMKAKGEDWFGSYVLPQAVLRLKQGLGRLLRTREDRGVMAILDARLHKKGYGKLVLNALPPARQTADIGDVERFFGEGDVPF